MTSYFSGICIQKLSGSQMQQQWKARSIISNQICCYILCKDGKWNFFFFLMCHNIVFVQHRQNQKYNFCLHTFYMHFHQLLGYWNVGSIWAAMLKGWFKSWSKEHQILLFIHGSGCWYVGWKCSFFSSLGVLGAADSHCNAAAYLSSAVQQLHPSFCNHSIPLVNIFNVTCFIVIGWFKEKKSSVYLWIVVSHGTCSYGTPLECGEAGGWHHR